MGILSYGKQSVTPALAGQLDASTRAASIDSMACSSTGPIPFGKLVERDGVGKVKDYDGTGTVYGLALREDYKHLTGLQTGASGYVEGNAVPCLRSGRAWMWTGNAASAFLVVGAAVAGVPSSEVIEVASDPNGDKLALVDINIPVA